MIESSWIDLNGFYQGGANIDLHILLYIPPTEKVLMTANIRPKFSDSQWCHWQLVAAMSTNDKIIIAIMVILSLVGILMAINGETPDTLTDI